MGFISGTSTVTVEAKLTDAGKLMSSETIRITGLEKGDYELLIDGTTVGNYSYLDYASGIELQGNKITPQYQQALKVAELNKNRNDEAIRPMRDLWLMRKIIHAFHETPEEFENEEEKKWAENYIMEEYGSLDLENFNNLFPGKLVPLEVKADQMEDEIYEMNKPVAHTYEVIKK
jgi:hypothetical protein